MGKPDVNIPESYSLEEIVDADKQINRFDSFNPWGSQTWNADKTAMTQAVKPELQAAVDKNIEFANRDAAQYAMGDELRGNMNALGSLMAERMGGSFQDVPGKSGTGGAAPAPALPADPAGPNPPTTPPPGGNPPPGGGGPGVPPPGAADPRNPQPRAPQIIQ